METVPVFSVKDPPEDGSPAVPAPKTQVPAPFFVQILLVPVVDLFCELHVSVTPSATSTMLPPLFELTVPPAVIVVFALTVILPTVVVAKVAADVALMTTSLLADQAVAKGPSGTVPQFAVVQPALVPFVFQ
jgi:hypothetical protein